MPTARLSPGLDRWLVPATIAAGLAWLLIVVAWQPLPHALTYDDAWYYFQIARNLSGGEGSTFDGSNVTNGYHPLWLLGTSVVYLVGLDATAAVRALLAFQLGLYVIALAVLARSLGRTGAVLDGRRSTWGLLADRPDHAVAGRWCSAAVVVVWVLATFNPVVLRLFVNGMESGLVALFGALLLSVAVRRGGDLLAAPVLTAVLLGMAFLARTDAVFIAGAALVWCALLRRRIDRRVLLVGAAFSTVVVAYLAVNVAIVGHPLQISGVTKQVEPDAGRLLLLVGSVAAAAALLVGGDRVRRRTLRGCSWRLPRTAAWFGATAWWASACALLVGSSRGLATEDYLWHYAPHGLWMIALLGSVVADLAEGAVAERPPTDPHAHRRAAVVALIALPFAVGAALQVRTFVDRESRSLQLGDRAAAEWVAANLPPDAVVASFDAGVLGYFADRPVVNLDGLVNSYEWRAARAAGTAATSAFLAEAGVTHLANHGELDESGEDEGLRSAADDLLGEGVGAAMVLVHREDYVFTGRTGSTSGRRPFATYVYELPRLAAGERSRISRGG